jgi:hypothetical protein
MAVHARSGGKLQKVAEYGMPRKPEWQGLGL